MSGNITTNVVRGSGLELRSYTAAWRPNNSGAALNPKVQGGIGTPTRTGTGTWTVAFPAGVLTATNVIGRSAHLALGSAGGVGRFALFGPIAIAANGVATVTIFTVDNGMNAQDVSAQADTWITFTITTDDTVAT